MEGQDEAQIAATLLGERGVMGITHSIGTQVCLKTCVMLVPFVARSLSCVV